MANATTVDQKRLGVVIRRAKKVARDYRALTGKPLGIAGEIGEFEASRLLGLELCEARQAGYDAIRKRGMTCDRIEIKTRVLHDKPNPGARLGSIKLNGKWNRVVLVLLDMGFEPTAIYEAGRKTITAALSAPGSIARNKRGALSISKFKSIGEKVWPTER